MPDSDTAIIPLAFREVVYMVALVGESVLVGVIVLFAHVIFPCIAAALLLPCNTSDRPTDPDDFARGFHRSTRTHSTTSYFLVSEIARSNRLSHVHDPHCDAASQTPTLPTKETTETPPPQTVSAAYVHIHTCLPALKHTFCLQPICTRALACKTHQSRG